MNNATSEFFAELGQRHHEPLLGKARGTVRFDIDREGATDHWLLSLDRGDIAVRVGYGDADAVVHTDARTFDRAARGQLGGLASVLRGAVDIQGDTELLVYAWRLFPGPSGNRDRQPAGAS